MVAKFHYSYISALDLVAPENEPQVNLVNANKLHRITSSHLIKKSGFAYVTIIQQTSIQYVSKNFSGAMSSRSSPCGMVEAYW